MSHPNIPDFSGPFDLKSQTSQLTGELDSAIAGTEFSNFMAKRKELLDLMMKTAMPATAGPVPLDPQGNPMGVSVQTPLTQNQKPSAQQLGQAQFWGIQDADKMPADQLQILIDQRRAEVPRQQETSVKSALLAGGAAAAQAVSTAAGVINNAFENLGSAASDVPFIGPALQSMLSSEQSKAFWQTLEKFGANAAEGAFAQQPKQDISAFQFLTGVGKMAGYALPAYAAWEGLGAIAGIPRLSWLANAGTPLMRLSAKGLLTSALLEDPNAPFEQKVMNLGLGAIMGGASMWGGPIGASVALGTVGAGVGANIGDTPQERTRNALIGGIGAAALPWLSPVAAQFFGKMKESFPGPADAPAFEINTGPVPPGTVDAEWWYENQIRQTSGNPPERQLGLPQKLLTGPSSEPTAPQTPQDLSELFRSLPTQTDGTPTAPPQGTVTPGAATETGAQPASRVAGYLETPGTASADMASSSYNERMDHADFLRRTILENSDPNAVFGYRRPEDSISATVALSDFHEGFVNQTSGGYTEPVTNAEFVADRQIALMRDAQAARYDNRRWLAKSNEGLSQVQYGPSPLIGSMVADSRGAPLRVYHGTGAAFNQYDLSSDSGGNLFGTGIYHTESPELAASYAKGDIYNWAPNAAQVVEQRVAAAFPNGPPPDLADAIQGVQLNWPLPLVGGATVGGYVPDTQVFDQHGIQVSDLIQPGSLPNIRPAFLDIKRPFNADQKYSLDDARAMIQQLEQNYPDYNWQDALDTMTPDDYLSGSITGEDLYRRIENVQPAYYKYTGDDQINANEALRSLGFDGITHVGGMRAGNGDVLHRVWIAFDPSQVHSPYQPFTVDASNAAEAASAITKQATVMESSHLPIAGAQSEVTEADVVTAAKSANPGGTAIIRNIGDPLTVMQTHPDVKYVQNSDGKLDAFIGKFTDSQISEFQKYGTYTGNIVTTPSGIEGEVTAINNGYVTLRHTAGGPPMRLKLENVYSSRYGTAVEYGPNLWEQFKSDLLGYLDKESRRAGMAPVESIWDPRAGQMMQTHLEDFLNRQGITDLAERHVIDQMINASYVNEAKDLDPESRALMEKIGFESVSAQNEAQASAEPIAVSLEEKADPKGFIWVSDPQTGGGMLRDQVNQEAAADVHFDSEEAADEFLKNVDRSVPDLTPASDVPMDVMEDMPTGSKFVPRVGAEEEAAQTAEDVYDTDKELTDLEATIGGGSGGGNPPGSYPGLGNGAPGELPPGPQDSVGSQFARLRHEHPYKWAWLQRRWSGNHLRYTRYLMASLERDLQSAGVDMARPWKDYESVETARVKADNEGFDWHKEFGDIVSVFPDKLLRSGFVEQTHMIQAEQSRMLKWWSLRDQGYTDAQIKKFIDADAKMNDIFNRLFSTVSSSSAIGTNPYPQIKNFIGFVRSRQALYPNDATKWYNPDGILDSNLSFFAQHVKKGMVQLRVADMRTLGNWYIRSVMWQKHQADAFEAFKNNWNDPRIPENIRGLMMDHLDTMQFGYSPEPTLATKAIRSVIEDVAGVPITNAEAARIGMGPLGWMYRSMLGGRTSIFFRDATQPLMALAKVRTGFMASVYKDILGYWRGGEGAEQLRADYQQALKAGWVTRERAPMEVASVFEDQAGANQELLGLTPDQMAKRESAARFGDILLPSWLRKLDDKANTLRLYGREQRLNQFISGLAAHRQATAALGEYRNLQIEAALSGDPSKAMDYDTFAEKSFFSSFEPAIQQRLKELVDEGNDEEAANLFARQVVNWSQQVYTTREKPKILRGGFGRLASFLGNWSGQFLEGVYSAMRWGKPSHIARALMVGAGFSYAMKKIAQKTGMSNISNWAWENALHFAGSPILQGGAQAVIGYQGLMNEAEGRSVGTVAGDVLKNAPTPAQFAADFLPYAGYVKTSGALNAAAQSSSPLLNMSRYLISGDYGSRVGYNLRNQQVADSIVNANQPPGYIPPRQ